jgi:trans-2,3-dihydro-3-hydroxyanthranilate isomerase
MSDMSGSYRYRIVDVFTEVPLEGNALAVFPEAADLDARAMQKIAREVNLSETAFVVPSSRADCAVGVRIFTPAEEMTFAGHPTIGTSFVLLEEGIVPANTECFALDEKVGPVSIRVEPGRRPLIWLRTPPIREGKLFDRTVCAKVLGLQAGDLLPVSPQMLSAGNPTVFIGVKDKDAVDRAWLDRQGSATLRMLNGENSELLCVFVFTPTMEGAYSRMFAPDHGVPEDPATGSSTGPLATFMLKHGLVANAVGTRFISEQGTKMQRRSRLHVQLLGEAGCEGIEVGGYVTPLAEGLMTLQAP